MISRPHLAGRSEGRARQPRRARAAALAALALCAGGVLGACGEAPKEHCARVHKASCPSDKPNANPSFAYDYVDPGATETDCEEALDSACSSEFAEYLDCLIEHPICCAPADADGAIYCGESPCKQDAFLACVSAL